MIKTKAEGARGRMIPVWVNGVVVLSAVLTGMGAVIAIAQPGMLVEPHAEITSAVRIYAGYLMARNLILSLMLLVLLAAGARRGMGNLLAVVGLIQVVDSVVDLFESRWTVAPGVLVLGLLCLLAASRLCGAPLWRKDAWI